MKKFLLSIICLLFLVPSTFAFAQVSVGNPTVINITVTGTAAVVLPYDGTVVDWTLHPENGSIRCEPGLINGQNSSITPTASVGMEYVSGSYLNNNSSPTVSQVCISESSSVTVSIYVDHRW